MSVSQMTLSSCPVPPFSLFCGPLGSFPHISAMELSVLEDLQRQGPQYSPRAPGAPAGGYLEAQQAARGGRGTREGCGDSGNAGALGETMGDKDMDPGSHPVGSATGLISLASQCVQDRWTGRGPPDPLGTRHEGQQGPTVHKPPAQHPPGSTLRMRGPCRRPKEKWQ